MAISLPSDIVSDVARAADPARVQAAAQRLSEGSGPLDGAGFDEVAKQVGIPSALGGLDVYTARNTLRNDAAVTEPERAKAAFEQFEAFVLQTFIESMLPKDAENTFGKGNAGAIWKSMMAEQLGAQISKAGGIGIASNILAGRSTNNQHRSLPVEPTASSTTEL
jgi:peptidoglycan hydrolase FlgJ